MSEWYVSRKKPNSNFKKLLQERIEKTNPRRTLTAEESKRLSKLEAIADKLTRGESVLANLLLHLYDDTDTYLKKMRDEIIRRT